MLTLLPPAPRVLGDQCRPRLTPLAPAACRCAQLQPGPAEPVHCLDLPAGRHAGLALHVRRQPGPGPALRGLQDREGGQDVSPRGCGDHLDLALCGTVHGGARDGCTPARPPRGAQCLHPCLVPAPLHRPCTSAWIWHPCTDPAPLHGPCTDPCTPARPLHKLCTPAWPLHACVDPALLHGPCTPAQPLRGPCTAPASLLSRVCSRPVLAGRCWSIKWGSSASSPARWPVAL